MITDETDPLMQAAARVLGQQLVDLCRGRAYDMALHRDLRHKIYDFRVQSRQQEIAFPQLTVMAVPRLGAISIYRKDLERPGIRGAVLQFIRMHPEVMRSEVVTAVTWAWPHIRPGDLIDEGFSIVAKDQAKASEPPES